MFKLSLWFLLPFFELTGTNNIPHSVQVEHPLTVLQNSSTIGLQDSLKSYLLLQQLDRSKPKAWILDLRNNRGGNCWPMMAGIGPLLGEGVCGYFVDPHQKGSSVAWSYRSGQVLEGSSINAKVSSAPYQLRQSIWRKNPARRGNWGRFEWRENGFGD